MWGPQPHTARAAGRPYQASHPPACGFLGLLEAQKRLVQAARPRTSFEREYSEGKGLWGGPLGLPSVLFLQNLPFSLPFVGRLLWPPAGHWPGQGPASTHSELVFAASFCRSLFGASSRGPSARGYLGTSVGAPGPTSLKARRREALPGLPPPYRYYKVGFGRRPNGIVRPSVEGLSLEETSVPYPEPRCPRHVATTWPGGQVSLLKQAAWRRPAAGSIQLVRLARLFLRKRIK